MEAEMGGFDDAWEFKSTSRTLADDGANLDGLVLKPAVHQVAGHGLIDSDFVIRACYGRPGPLVDDSGLRFFKPLKEGDYRAEREISFYDKIKLDGSIPSHVKEFFPSFYGTKFLPSADGTGFVRHGIMENLTYGFKNPSVTDIKIGHRTWYLEASEDYKKKQIKKDQQTTSGVIGFRISGMKIYEVSEGTTWRPERKWLRNMSVDMIRPCMERYVSSNPFSDNPDAAFAASVYGGAHGVLAKLKQLEEWFSTQTSYHFYSTSILIIYESSSTTGTDGPTSDHMDVAVKLVDFAHSFEGNGIDENFLAGLKAFISIISGILEEHAS